MYLGTERNTLIFCCLLFQNTHNPQGAEGINVLLLLLLPLLLILLLLGVCFNTMSSVLVVNVVVLLRCSLQPRSLVVSGVSVDRTSCFVGLVKRTSLRYVLCGLVLLTTRAGWRGLAS